MRAKDYIELNCKNQFYNELKRVINDLSVFRKDKNATENYFELYLNQDRKHKLFESDLKDWKLNNLNLDEMPKYIEHENCIPFRDAYNFRNHLFNVIENDKSFGYLFYLLASEKNRTEIHYQNNPIECIPDKQIIEENIIKYQDDYPKHNLDEYLTYNDFNYKYYKSNNKLTHSKDLWFIIFTTSYSQFDNLRTKMVSPFLAFDVIKEFCEKDKSKKTLIITLVSQLLEQYNYDLTEEQLKGKNILANEIDDYLKLLNEGKIPADPNIRSFDWLSKHPNLMTTKEQQVILNSFKILRDIGTEIQSTFPTFELVKSIIDETPEIEDKIILLEDVIATWEVNASIAIIQREDDTAEEIANKEISTFNAMLAYWKKMQDLENRKALPKLEISKKSSFLDERKDINDQFYRPDIIATLEENSRNSDSETLIQTKSQLLKSKLSKYDFFSLDKIKILTPDKQSILVDKLVVKGIPYTIAMFDYIDFFKLLDNQYFETINKRNIQIADWLNTDVRSIRGNKNVLDKGTTENKKRYTAHLHKEKVIKDYELLK